MQEGCVGTPEPLLTAWLTVKDAQGLWRLAMSIEILKNEWLVEKSSSYCKALSRGGVVQE